MAPRAHADQWDKKTILTVNQPIQVEERLLPPGQYVLKLLNSNSDRHIVQIYNSDQSHMIDTVLAIPNYRLQPTGKSQFLFWETPPGSAKALRAWFYPGDNFGQEFTYPKHLQMLEASVSTTTAVPAPAPPTTVAPSQEETMATPPPAQVETQPAQPEPSANREEQPVETAQAAPPPPQPVPTDRTPAPAPSRLPQTASSYPLIGLIGVFSLGLFGLLRLKQSA